MKTSIKLLAVVTAVLAAAPAFAIDPGACCVQGTSRLDALLNPPKGSDEAFFSSGGAPPNVTLILDTSCSMNAWPQNFPSGDGCNHPGFAGNGYDPSTTYRPVVASIDGAGNEVSNPRWFNNNLIYRMLGSASSSSSSMGHDLNGFPYGNNFAANTWAGSGTLATARDAACNDVGTNATERAACRACIDTKGYYIRGSTRIGSGNFLRFYAPRDVSALMVLSQLLFDVREIRLSILTFDNWSNNSADCWNGSNVCMWQKPKPDCNQLQPFDQTSVTATRNSILANMATNKPFNASTPIAASLYAAMYAMRSTSPSDTFTTAFGAGHPKPSTGTGNTFTETGNANEKRICTACGFNAVIALTDGEPNENMITNWPSQITGMTTTCSGTACGSALNEIAAYFWQTGDVRSDYPQDQRIATYTIGFGTNTAANNLLSSTAQSGGGSHFSANNAAGIVKAFQDIFEDISTRNTSFSAAAVSAVQTGSSSTPAVLPRLVPRKDTAWAGRLWRFDQYNEFVEDADLNADGDKNDVFIVEKPCPGGGECALQADGGRPETAVNIVTEDSTGNFVRLANPTVAATPYWEGSRSMLGDGGVGAINARNIWTVVDTNSDGTFTEADGMLQIKLLPLLTGSISIPDGGTLSAAAYDGMMADYLGIKGSDKCPSSTGPGTLLSRMGLDVGSAWGVAGWTIPPLVPNAADYDRLCTRIVIMWTLGYDLLNGNIPAKSTTARADILGDIFHSSPISVEPPFEPFLCDLGLSTQCARTLYAQTGGNTQFTPLSTAANVNVCPTPVTVNKAYDVWQTRNHRRQRLLLVGANDGMLHAFDNGEALDASNNVITGGNNSNDICTGGKPTPRYGHGSGREVWAFVPPDQLPRLADQVLGHQYLVDGDIMVRDIWNDDNKDGIKQHTEFRTMAVLSEGRGGTHYLALEIPFDVTGNRAIKAATRPNFRWMFPQPCSDEAATFGKTFFSLSPKAPPIGPVLMDNDSIPATEKASSGALTRYGVPNTIERWVVALSGGWSPGLERGRGVYVVDAWNGKVGARRDNLWWKFEFNPTATGDLTPARGLRHSVPAPVALVDYGPDAQPGQDAFFDTAVWGDTAGQVWLARFAAPATYDTNTNLISNWSAARALEMDAAGGTSVRNKQPFYYLPSVAVEPGNNRLRVFIGSGNRYALLERKGGMCRFDNPLACAKAGCTSTTVDYAREDGILDIDLLSNRWGANTLTSSAATMTRFKGDTTALSFADTCGSTSTPRLEAEMTSYRTAACGLTSTSPNAINESRFRCGLLNGADGGYTCQQVSVSRNGSLGDLLTYPNIPTTGLGLNRFVGFWAYGDGIAFGGDAGSPATFDNARISDRGGLVDVTGVTCTATSCSGGATANTDRGWVMDYDQLEAKTATGAAVVTSCVLWSDLTPGDLLDGGTASCGGGQTSTSRIYQADFITGQPNCAYGFLQPDAGVYARSQARTVLAPPPEPASVVQVSKTGQLKYSAMLVEPGKSQATTVDVTGATDVLQLVYQLPVTRALHNCRHSVDGGCLTSP